MSYNMQITNINQLNIPSNLFDELHSQLQEFRPEEITTNKFPESFNDDATECIMNFFEKYKLSGTIDLQTEDETYKLEYLEGVLIYEN